MDRDYRYLRQAIERHRGRVAQCMWAAREWIKQGDCTSAEFCIRMARSSSRAAQVAIRQLRGRPDAGYFIAYPTSGTIAGLLEAPNVFPIRWTAKEAADDIPVRRQYLSELRLPVPEMAVYHVSGTDVAKVNIGGNQ